MNDQMNSTIREMPLLKKCQSTIIRETGHRKFEVQRRNYRLVIGEKVTPETIIGKDYHTQENLTAGCYGKVATAYFNPMHDSLMIMVIVTNFDTVNGSGKCRE